MLKKIAKSVLVTLLASLVAFYFLSRPITTGTLHVHSHKDFGRVEITRDTAFGIPRVYSEDSFDGALYGIGFAQAQDRLWQIHLNRIVANGALAESFGEALLNMDVFTRTIGVRQLAADSIAYLRTFEDGRRTLRAVEAFVDGVNDAVAQTRALPIEFQILRSRTSQYFDSAQRPFLTVLEVFAMLELQAITMTWNYQTEPTRSLLSKLYGADAALTIYAAQASALFANTTILNDEELRGAGLFDAFTASGTREVPDDAQSVDYDAIARLLENLAPLTTTERGSNSWVVDGKHTSTGRPLIANDPHLPQTIPSTWYQMEVLWRDGRGGDVKHVVGAGIAGIPFVLTGMSDYAAWTVTLSYQDGTDLYQEVLNDDGTKYLHEGVWRDLKVLRQESIKIAGSTKTHNFDVKATHHGPLLELGFSSFSESKIFRIGTGVSFAWGGFHANDSTTLALYKIGFADSFDVLRDIAPLIQRPAISMLFATRDGHTGFYATGTFPKRRDVFAAQSVQDGTRARNDWLGLTDTRENAHSFDARKGYYVACNNKFATDNFARGASAVHGYNTARAQRATQLIDAYLSREHKISPRDFMDMQRDTVTTYTVEVLPYFIAVFDVHGARVLGGAQELSELKSLVNVLKTWNGEMGVDSAGAAIFSAWDSRLRTKLFVDAFGSASDAFKKLTSHTTFDHFLYARVKEWGVQDARTENWCVTETNTGGDCAQNVIEALREASQDLKRAFGEGTQPSQYRWGAIHRKRYSHAAFGKRLLKFLFNREVEAEGGRSSLAVNAYMTENFDVAWSSGYRGIYSLSANGKDDDGNSYWIVDTGASGDIFSPHYDDQLAVWQRGEYLPLRHGAAHYKTLRDGTGGTKSSVLVLAPKENA